MQCYGVQISIYQLLVQEAAWKYPLSHLAFSLSEAAAGLGQGPGIG